MTIDSIFAQKACYLDVDAIDRSTDSVYLLDDSLNIVGYNDYYLSFASKNGTPDIEERYGLGKSILSAILGNLKTYYQQAYVNALKENSVFSQNYECSSCDQFRVFHQTAYPLYGKAGLVVTNHCVVEKDLKGRPVCFGKEHYNLHGFVVQCSNCRKIQNHSKVNKWDWIPDAVEHNFPNTSHSMCLHCLDHYYPDIE